MESDLDVHRRLVTDRLAKDDLDLDEYDAFLESWHSLVKTHGSGRVGQRAADSKLQEVEELAKVSLARLIQQEANGKGVSGSALFDSLQVGASLCDARGDIQQSNDQALKLFGLREGSNIAMTQLALEGGAPLTPAAFVSHSIETGDLNILQTFRPDGSAVNLAVLGLGGDKQIFLIVFMDTPWGPEAQGMLAARFGLSDVEAEIIGSFASGVSLKQIALDRGRAYATIRNQFQAVLEKTGCPNQSDLLRLLLGTSYLFAQIQSLVVQEKPTRGKAVEMIRPKGRFLDVQLFGDPAGQPFICLPSIFGLPITPKIDAELRERSLLMIGIARPGFGATSPPVEGQTIYDTLAKDVVAVLDSMEIERCVFMGRASAARSLFNLTKAIPDRITRGIIVNGMVPPDYVAGKKVRSRWTRSLMSATAVSSPVATLILGLGKQLMLRIGVEKFLLKMYGHAPSDRAGARDIAVSESILAGVEYVTKQGLNAGAVDMIEGFADWRGEISAAQVACTLVHGTDDPHVPIIAVRAMAAEFADQLDLIEVEDGGGLLNYTHTDMLFDLVTANS